MDTEQSLTNIKTILGMVQTDESKDDLLNLYITRAKNFALKYCHLDAIPDDMVPLVEDMALFRYRNKGVENLSSSVEGALSENYMENFPDDYLTQLDQYKKLIFI